MLVTIGVGLIGALLMFAGDMLLYYTPEDFNCGPKSSCSTPGRSSPSHKRAGMVSGRSSKILTRFSAVRKAAEKHRISKDEIRDQGNADMTFSANIEELKAKDHPFTCKVFENMGHSGLVGENTERFIKEVEAVHRNSNQITEERV